MSKALMRRFFKILNSRMHSHVQSALEYLGTQYISVNVNISSANAVFRIISTHRQEFQLIHY